MAFLILAFCVAAAAQMANSLSPEGMVNMTDRSITLNDDLTYTSCLRDTDFYGQTLGKWTIQKSWQDCEKLCNQNVRCKGFTYATQNFNAPKSLQGYCWLKSGTSGQTKKKNLISGLRGCGKESLWRMGNPGQTCKDVCGADARECDTAKQSSMNTAEKVYEAFLAAGYSCKSFGSGKGQDGAPLSTKMNDDCIPFDSTSGKPSSCDIKVKDESFAPLCYCKVPAPPAKPASYKTLPEFLKDQQTTATRIHNLFGGFATNAKDFVDKLDPNGGKYDPRAIAKELHDLQQLEHDTNIEKFGVGERLDVEKGKKRYRMKAIKTIGKLGESVASLCAYVAPVFIIGDLFWGDTQDQYHEAVIEKLGKIEESVDEVKEKIGEQTKKIRGMIVEKRFQEITTKLESAHQSMVQFSRRDNSKLNVLIRDYENGISSGNSNQLNALDDNIGAYFKTVQDKNHGSCFKLAGLSAWVDVLMANSYLAMFAGCTAMMKQNRFGCGTEFLNTTVGIQEYMNPEKDCIMAQERKHIMSIQKKMVESMNKCNKKHVVAKTREYIKTKITTGDARGKARQVKQFLDEYYPEYNYAIVVYSGDVGTDDNHQSNFEIFEKRNHGHHFAVSISDRAVLPSKCELIDTSTEMSVASVQPNKVGCPNGLVWVSSSVIRGPRGTQKRDGNYRCDCGKDYAKRVYGKLEEIHGRDSNQIRYGRCTVWLRTDNSGKKEAWVERKGVSGCLGDGGFGGDDRGGLECSVGRTRTFRKYGYFCY